MKVHSKASAGVKTAMDVSLIFATLLKVDLSESHVPSGEVRERRTLVRNQAFFGANV
jgi:hypothetical protein